MSIGPFFVEDADYFVHNGGAGKQISVVLPSLDAVIVFKASVVRHECTRFVVLVLEPVG